MKAYIFASEWIASWNSHDLDDILSHYSDDIEVTTPMIKLSTGVETGSLKGKKAVGEYWKKALDKIPDLHFELIEVTAGITLLHSIINR
jgi:ketosteroid isomerase-like protein